MYLLFDKLTSKVDIFLATKTEINELTYLDSISWQPAHVGSKKERSNS